MRQSVVNDAFRSCLEAVKEETPELFPPDHGPGDYDVDRSLRGASDSRAKALGVSLDDINVVNRWRKVEEAKGRKTSQGMSDGYADVELIRPMCIRYTVRL
mmetsp:Transcript_28008/g.50711  ORF Transcript_28008/g.50711 Transcript_28008/m.50711 type:complete len:101 (+) Transcript_28008:6634-6936(+)